MHEYVPSETNTALLRRASRLRSPIAGFGQQRQELLYAQDSDTVVRLAAGNRAENRKVFVDQGDVTVVPSGAGLWNGLEQAAANGHLTALTALSIALLRVGYLVDYQRNDRWIEGDPIFSMRTPQELIDLVEADLPRLPIANGGGTITVTPTMYIATIDAIGFAEDVKYRNRHDADRATPNPAPDERIADFWEGATGRPNSVLTSANCAMHSAKRTLTTFANELGRGRGVAPLTASRARQLLTQQQ